MLLPQHCCLRPPPPAQACTTTFPRCPSSFAWTSAASCRCTSTTINPRHAGGAAAGPGRLAVTHGDACLVAAGSQRVPSSNAGQPEWRPPLRAAPTLFFTPLSAQTYWDLTLDGVPGTVQLYANSPDRHSALAGSAAYPFELSMRITRKDAGEQLQHALALLAEAATVLGQNGWDAAPATSAPRDLA